jgi:Holliday junction resolvase RusA-like endonuclease
MIRLVIPGEAVPQLRPRFARLENSVRAYDPSKCKNYKAYIRYFADEVKPKKLIEGAVLVTIKIYRLTPQSWGKTKKALAMAGALRPITKPDVDNLAKGIKDALKGIIWRDDSQVVDLHVQKWYSDEPRAEVEIDEISA